MTRSYYCDICQKTVTFNSKEIVKKCICSKVFEANSIPAYEINMRKTWSGQTKVEFSQTTIGDDIKARNNGI